MSADIVASAEMLLAELELWPVFGPVIFRSITVIGLCCTDDGCREVAPWRCYWPGSTRAKCTAHRDGWARIADAMGFALVSEPLEVREPDPTAARFAAMELY